MKVTKTSPIVAFDVIYEDGTRRHATEGVFFEIDKEDNLICHTLTDRQSPAFLAIFGGIYELVFNSSMRKCFRCLWKLKKMERRAEREKKK